nr:uncharacterized protein LOC109157631 [Ipomoea trifida]
MKLHASCSNGAEEEAMACGNQSEQRRWNHGGGGGAPSRSDSGTNRPSEYSGDKIKQRDREEGMEKSGGKNPAASTSLPRTATRRYKLLKDVMC